MWHCIVWSISANMLYAFIFRVVKWAMQEEMVWIWEKACFLGFSFRPLAFSELYNWYSMHLIALCTALWVLFHIRDSPSRQCVPSGVSPPLHLYFPLIFALTRQFLLGSTILMSCLLACCCSVCFCLNFFCTLKLKFSVSNLKLFQTNSPVHTIHTGTLHHLHRPVAIHL